MTDPTPAQVTVLPILATPLGIVLLPRAETDNRALENLFTARRKTSGAEPPSGLPFHRSWDDLCEWPELPVRRLAADMLDAVYSVVTGLNDLTPAQLLALKPEVRAWFTLIEQDGAVPATSYPLTAWCAIYCVAAPEPTTRLDSGILRLYESRLGGSFQDATNATMKLPYRLGHYGWRPVPGQMAVFPGCVTHEIAPVRASAGTLILVTARVRFVGPGQTEMARW